MAVVSILGTATFNTTSGTKTVTATPAVGDLIVIVTANSGSTTTTAAPTDNNGGGGTYTLVNTAVKATSADTMQVWVRNALITSTASTTFTQAPGTTTGGGLVVLDVQGMDKVGASAVVRSGIQSNQASATTPAPTLGATPGINNAIISAVFNASNPVAVTARTGYSTAATGAYNTPATGISVIERDSGETSATITWGGTSATAFASIAVELDARVTHATTGALTGQGSAVAGSANHATLHATSGVLAGQGSAITGSAARASSFVTHDTSGTLTGPGSSLAGAASRTPPNHAASGDLAGSGAAVTGASTRVRVMSASGALVGAYAVVSGAAARTVAPVTHNASGALVGLGAVIDGAASAGVVGGGAGDYDDKPKRSKRRYVVEIDGRLHAFSRKADALQALNSSQPAKSQKKAAPVEAKPVVTVSLQEIKQLADQRQQVAQYEAQLQAMRYEALLRLYEEMRDEQDIEELLAII